MISPADIENWFSYHKPTPEQIPAYEEIRNKAKEFADYLNEKLPDGADKTYTLRLLRQVVMNANQTIACST